VKPGREKSLLRRHPWVFSGAVARLESDPGAGETVEIVREDGRFLARAAYSPQSQIRARVWSFDENEPVDSAFFERRVARAVRKRLAHPQLRDASALRLLNGESDGLPGVFADRYADTVVLQVTSTGGETWRDAIVAALRAQTGCGSIHERSDTEVRTLEGLSARAGVLLGEPNPDIEIEEHGVRYRVDVARGHKTGFYLDQRFNRRWVGELACGAEMLDCFCYTGSFSLVALRHGAKSVLALESSAQALELARENARRNGFESDRAQWLETDVFAGLRRLRDQGRSFDLIVLDPPKFAPTAAHAERAARAYKDINFLAFKLLRPGGFLFTFSCSGGVSRELFQKIVAGAALDAGADAHILRHLGASADHPVALSFPEGEYLKGLLCQRV
jgi:23S rRNA (cytosine1962-C5)-methyltransferase